MSNPRHDIAHTAVLRLALGMRMPDLESAEQWLHRYIDQCEQQSKDAEKAKEPNK